MEKNDSKKMMRKLKYMRKIKTYLIILLISFFFVLTISAENKVAGIELKQHFTNLNSVDYFDSEVRYTYVPINFFFGKSKVKIPSSFFTKFTSFNGNYPTGNFVNNLTTDKEYFCRLKAVGGKKKKYSWIAFIEDDLPAGLRLNPEGELREVPSETGEYQIRISVCDGKDIADKDLNITILPARDGLILKPGEGKVELRD